MSSETTNLHLVKPTSADTADIGIINGNMDIIDAAIGSIITVGTATATINKTVGSYASISAPAVDGYTFVAWIGCATDGWVASTYISEMNSAATWVWVSANQSDTTGSGTVRCFALYRKS